MGRKKMLPNRGNLILEAAALLFSESSYEKTTLDEIAVRAGISKGSIYLEFPSKEEILYSLIQRHKEIELADMHQIAAQSASSTLNLLKTMLVQNMGAIFDSMKQKQLSPEDLPMETRKHVRERIKPFIEARLTLIEELLARAEQAGEIKALKERYRTAQLIMMALRAVLPPYREETNRVRLQHDASELLELIINGLR